MFVVSSLSRRVLPTLSRSLRANASTSVAPGVPNASSPPVANFLANVQLPDVSALDPEAVAQIPYSFDSWESQNQPKPAVAQIIEDTLPKLVVIAGADLHPVGGASHELLDGPEDSHTHDGQPQPSSQLGQGGLLDDIVEDLTGSTIAEIKASLPKVKWS